MLKFPHRLNGRTGADLAAARAELSHIREVADSAVQHEINRIELAHPDMLEHDKRRLIAHATRPHREWEDAAVRAVIVDLTEADRRRLFDETLDPRVATEASRPG